MAVVLFFILVPFAVFAQTGASVQICVHDISGHSISNAEVKIGSVLPETQNEGCYTFQGLAEGSYLIQVNVQNFVAMDTIIFVHGLESIELKIVLQRITKTFADVIIESDYDPAVKSFSRKEIQESTTRDLPSFLNSVAGVDIRSDGTAGGVSAARIGGSNANQVMVLIDGRKATEIGSGETDLSAIPLDWIEAIEIHRGSDSELGGEAIGGIISITTRMPNRNEEVNLFAQTFPTYSTITGSRGGAVGNLTTYISMTRKQGSGNYSYKISEDDGSTEFTENLGETFQRQNSDITRDLFFGKLTSTHSHGILNANITAEYSERGMPGYIAPRFTPQARQSNRKWNAGLVYSSSIGKISFNPRLSHMTFRRDFSDPDPFSLVHSAHESGERNEAEIKGEWSTSNWKFNHGSSFAHEVLRSDQLTASEAKRNRYAVWSGADYLIAKQANKFDIRARSGLRFEGFGESTSTLPQLGVSTNYFSWYNLFLDLNASKSYRAPDLYSLFWADDQVARGNPDLLPEESEQIIGHTRVESNVSHETALEITASKQNVTNLIQWMQTFDGHWMPVNVKSAKISNLDVEVSQVLPFYLTVISAVNWLEARNNSDDRNTGGKYLTFRAPRTHRANVEFTPGNFRANLNYRWVAARPVLDTNFKRLSEYTIIDFTCSYNFKYSKVSIKPSFSIMNLTDETYRIIRHAPMPQREISGSIQLTYTP